MEDNCFILKLKDFILGNYDKLNFLKIKVLDGQTVIFGPDTKSDVTIKAEGCTFTLPHLLIKDATEYIFKYIVPYTRLDLKIKGNGYLYIGNKYNIGRYLMYNVDLNKIYSYNKAIKLFNIPYSNEFNISVKGDINHLLSLCSPDLESLVFNKGITTNYDIIGDITEINKFTKLKILSLNNKIFSDNISIFSSLINLTSLWLYDSNFTGSVEELALAWYNNGKTSGTINILAYDTSIIIPSTITDKSDFYCTFTEEGYTFSLRNPNA